MSILNVLRPRDNRSPCLTGRTYILVEGTEANRKPHEHELIVLRAILTSTFGSILDKTLSGAFLTSSMRSGPAANTIHLRKFAILNKPGLV